jgi:hypothetical protein
MSAKFVNLIEFFECKIFPEVELVTFLGRGIDGNTVVMGIHAVNMRPQEEFTFRQRRDADAGMVDGNYLF